MRHFLAPTVALLMFFSALPASAQVQISVQRQGPAGVTMPLHPLFLKDCARSYLGFLALSGRDLAAPESQAQTWEMCQCDFEQLPPPGQRAWPSQFQAASAACQAAAQAEPEVFRRTWRSRLLQSLSQATFP